MTSQPLTVQAYLDYEPQKITQGKLELVTYDEKDRLRRSLKSLGLIWGIAIACVLIPLLHFILVPGGLIAGPVVAFLVHGVQSEILNGSVQCPKCAQGVSIAKQKLKPWPMRELCTHCRSEFHYKA